MKRNRTKKAVGIAAFAAGVLAVVFAGYGAPVLAREEQEGQKDGIPDL